MTFMCDLDIRNTDFRLERDTQSCLVNIYAKYHKKLTIRFWDTDPKRKVLIWRLPLCVTLTFMTRTSVPYATNYLVVVNIYGKYHKDPFIRLWDTEWKRKFLYLTYDLYVWPWPLKQRLSSCTWNIVLL